MIKGATKEILNMIKRAEQKKTQLEQKLHALQSKKERDIQRLRRNEFEATNSSNDRNLYGSSYLKNIYEDKKTIMDDDHEISETKREIISVDKKIREIKHWTAQSEYEDDFKRREAVDNAKRILQSL